MNEERRTSSAAETEALAGELAGSLRPGDLIVLTGDLGTGKTTFVRGAARALGVEGPVTSPTFTIGRRHRGARVAVAHVDLFRLGSLAGEDPALLEDYLGPELITFVEWPERAGAELPEAAVHVRLEHAGGDERRITIERG